MPTGEFESPRFIPPAVLEAIDAFDWTQRPAGALNEFMNGAVKATNAALERMRNASEILERLVTNNQSPGVLESQFHSTEDAPLLNRLLIASMATSGVQSQCYWLVVATLLFELEVGVTDVFTRHTWDLERLIPECQAYNDVSRFELTIERCESHLGISRNDYALNHSQPLRDKYNSMGPVILINSVGFFRSFAEAFRCQGNYEYAVGVADCLLRSDVAIEQSDADAEREVVRSRMDDLMPPRLVNEEGTVDEDSKQRQLRFVLELVECFDRSICQLISEAAFAEVGALRKRRELIRTSILGIEPGYQFRWERIETLARWAPQATISLLFSRWLRNVDDSELETQFVRNFSRALKEWRGPQPKMGWWSMPYPAARTLLIAELSFCFLFRIGHRRVMALVDDILIPPKNGYWELGNAFKNAPDATLVRLANHAVNGVTLALANEADRSPAIETLESYLGIGPGQDHNALSDGLSDVIRERCGIRGETAQWDHAAFGMHARLGFLLIQVNRVFEGTHLSRELLGIKDADSPLDTRMFEAVIQEDPTWIVTLLGTVLQLAEIENNWAPAQQFFGCLLAIDDSAWSNASRLVDAIRKCIQDRQLSAVVAHHLVSGITMCTNKMTEDPSLGIEVIRQYLEIDNLTAGRRLSMFDRQEPHIWGPLVSDLIGQLTRHGDYEAALGLVSGICERSPSDPFEFARIVGVFSPRGVGKLFEDLFGPNLVESTIIALKGVQREHEAVALANDVSQAWLKSETENISTAAKCSLALTCIRTLIGADSEIVRDLLWEVSWFLKSDHDTHNLTSVDRIRLAALTVECRHLLIEVTNTLALSEDAGEQTLVSLYANELFLSVQQIVDRIRRGVPALTLGDGPSLAPGWSMAVKSRRRIRRLRSKSRGATALSQIAVAPERSTTVSVPQPSVKKHQEWFSEVRWRSRIEDSIGAGRHVLKVGFTVEGQLVWSLLEVQGAWIGVKAMGQGSSNARDQITAAVERFQRKLDALWDVRALADQGTLTRAVENLCWQLNLDQGELISPKAFLGDAANRLLSLREEFPRTHDQFLQQFGPPATWLKGKIPLPVRTEWEKWWTDTIQLLNSSSCATQAFSEELDQVTLELLDEVASDWPLEALFKALGPDVELLIQPSGVLHSVPISFLSLKDANGQRRFLFEQVESAAVIVSPLIDWWQRETLDSAPPLMSGDAHQLACLSWLRSGELQREAEAHATYLLQASHARLAKRAGEGYRWWSAGGSRKTPGSHRVLARGLRDAGEGGFALLTICGHGASNRSGILLKDGLWQGREFLEAPECEGDAAKRGGGVDLANAQFVILLSCSMGRLTQSRLRDVEGFCIDLTINQARSVLAGRWTLHAADSIKFAHLVSRHYLRNHRTAVAAGQPLWKSCARGKAVAQARRRWAQEFRSGRARIGINTVAALELYGLR